MEEQVNLGSVGSADVAVSAQSEVGTVKISKVIGPLTIEGDLKVTVDNKVLADLVVAKLPAGVAQTIAKDLEGMLFPAAAPSA